MRRPRYSWPREGPGTFSEALWSLNGTAEELIDLTVVLPFYNPGAHIKSTIERTVEVLGAKGITFEVVAVSDGSTDGSELLLRGLHPEIVTVVVLPERGGKGQAVREGLMRGRGRYLGFIDGDGDVPPDLLADFWDLVLLEHPDVLIGSKRHPASQVVYPVARRMYSWGYQQLVRAMFRLDVHDTQAGIKLVRRDVLCEVLPSMVEQGYAFDLELLVAARHFGHHHVLEGPVRIGRRFSSTISPVVIFEMLADTGAIWWRLHVARAYEPRGSGEGVVLPSSAPDKVLTIGGGPPMEPRWSPDGARTEVEQATPVEP